MSLASLIDELNPQQKQAATTEVATQSGARRGWLWQDENHCGTSGVPD